MKRLIPIFVLLLFTLPLLAQVPTPTTAPNIIDSTGTTGTFWQAIDFLTVAARTVTFQNTGANSMKAALRAEDTVSTRTRYQKTISPGMLITLMTTQRYVYVISTDTTLTTTYAVSNVLILNSQDTETSLDSIEANIIRIGLQLPSSKPKKFTDSLLTTNATLTAYTAGDEISTSTSAPSIRRFDGVFLSTTAISEIVSVVAKTDTNVSVTAQIDWYGDSVAVNNDNAAYQTLLASSYHYLGSSTLYLTAGGTGSTVSQGMSIDRVPIRSTGSGTKLFYRVRTLTAVTLKHQGRLIFDVYVRYF